MKIRKALVIGGIIFALSNTNLYANTTFNVNRKAMKIYDRLDLNSIITTTDSPNLTYTSSNDNVATVDENGVVFTNSLGQAIITVSDGVTSSTLTLSSGYYTGIDVSYYNGNINWQKVKKEGIDFAMIRGGYGWYDQADIDAGLPFDCQVDKQFLNNLRGATDNNIPFGLYHVSYANTLEKAEKEADYALRIINEYGSAYKDKVVLPIAYDVEVDSLKNVGKAELTNIIIRFCTRIYEGGYTPVLYSYKSFISQCIDIDKINAMAYNIWYADYGSNNVENVDFSTKKMIVNTQITPFMWQYSSNGSIDGANTSSGHVDLNVMYMKDRAKVEVSYNNNIVYTMGTDKGEAIEYYPQIKKAGYNLTGFRDSSNVLVNNEYRVYNDLVIYPEFSKILFTNLELNLKEITVDTLTPDEDYALNVVSVLPQEAIIEEGDVAFESSNDTIASVDENGKITFNNRGECNIIAYSTRNREVYDSCKVVIAPKSVKGDVSEDGYINATDAAMVLDFFKNKNATIKDFELGDMNVDGYLNSTDAAMIIDIFKK